MTSFGLIFPSSYNWVMVGDLGRFLGRHHPTTKVDEQELFAFDMRACAQDIVMEYLRITNGKLKHVNTPFFAHGDTDTDDSRGELADKASNILMKMMWLARLARPDLLRVMTWLATRIQKWCSSCDVALFRAVSYIVSTKSHLLTGYVNDEPKDVFVEFFVGADLCGASEDCCSTSGTWIQLSGKSASCPLSWISKKQTSVSRSTTESETVALALRKRSLWRSCLAPSCREVSCLGFGRTMKHVQRYAHLDTPRS